jgi:hypothetical protein
MKFPVLFRILAAFNMLSSLLMLFMLIAMATSRGALIGVSPHLYAQFWLTALWMLAISFAWFFAAKQSYGLLIINFITTLAVAVIIVLMGWQSAQDRPSERPVVFIMAVVPVIYSLFSLFGLFYKPTREWANSVSPDGVLKANRGVLITALVSVAIFVGAGYAMQSYKPNEHEVVSCQTVFSRDSETSVFRGNYPYDFKPGENIDIPMTDKACFDVIKISAVSNDYRPWTSARMVDAEGTEQQLSFTRQGEYYIAKVKATCSERITIYTTAEADSAVYSVASLQLVRRYSLFEEDPTDYVSMLPGGSDEEYIMAEVGYGEPTMTQENIQSIIERGMNILLREVGWNFEEVVNDNKGWTGPGGAKIGVFAHGLAGLRDVAVQTISEHIGGDYIKEAYITEVLGAKLFDASPTDDYDPAPYRKVNPETITWIARNFIPIPSTELGIEGNPTMLKIYEENFQRLARLLVETRQYLYHNTDLNAEKTAYEEAMAEEGFHGPSWLSARYENLFLDQYGPEYTQGTFNTPLPPLLVGFWLRRELDGSSEAIWSAMSSFMMQYDPGWYMQNTEEWGRSEGD